MSNDSFLDLVTQVRKGRFKVYLGMITGVGKTYRMLQEAHDLLDAGISVKIGFLETHNRKDVTRLSEGIPTIPRKKVFYKGQEVEEMDLDTILNEAPEVVLIDELAHSNIPGSTNEKRWQDVRDILRAGISVITAFNVQSLESMVDKVERIAGIKVSETIPDKILRHADEVINIDMPASDLIKRLKEGKIYKAERDIEESLNNLFQPDIILQLRDLALRQVASQVERKIERSLPAATRMPIERFLACISTNAQMAELIIRKTSRIAMHYQAEWFVLFIQTRKESSDHVDLAAQRKLLANFKWAKELGATVLKETSNDVPEVIFNNTRKLDITTVVLGRPHFSLIRQLSGRNYFDQLLRKLSDTDIDVIIVS